MQSPFPIDIPPGVVKTDSPNAAKGRYTDCDKFRFKGNYPEKWLGWERFLPVDQGDMVGVPRGAVSWANVTGTQNSAWGTHLKLYAVTGGDTLVDITPIRESGTLGTDPFSITTGSTTVTVTDVGHGLEIFAFVVFSGADASALIDRSLGTNRGDATGSGGLAGAFDDTTNQASAACATKAAATFAYVGKSLATPAPIYKAIVYGSNDAGYVTGANPNVTIELYGKNGAAPSTSTDGTLLGTLAAFADTANESGNARTVVSGDTTTIYDHAWVRVSHNGVAATMSIAEVQLFAYFKVDGEYQVTSVISSSSYTISHSLAAKTIDATVGGVAVAYDYLINPGGVNPGFGGGWGVEGWGEGGWGEEHTGSDFPIDLRHWSLQPYGNNLLATPFGDTLYQWIEADDDRALAVTNAPLFMRGMFVTSERFVFALGTDDGLGNVDPMRLQWPDQDDITDWTPTSANNANSRTLQNGSKLVAGCALQNLVSLVWTDTALYVFQYTGDTSVYADRMAGDNCGLVGGLAFCNISGTAFWISGSDAFMYSGSVQAIPNFGDISEFFFADSDPDLISKTAATYNKNAGSIVFHYVSRESTDEEPDKYIEVSLDKFAWSCGTLRRSTSTLFVPRDGSLLMADPDGEIFLHEIGVDDDGAAMNAFIQFGEYTLKDGGENADVMGFIPDFQRQVGDVEVTLYTKDRPNSPTNMDEQVLTIVNGAALEDARISGRHFGFIVRTNEAGGDCRLGIPALEIGPAGARR